jgi:HprK-related kinase A
MYPDFSLEEGGFADFNVSLVAAEGIRRWWRPQAQFLFDGETPFEPLPLRVAVPFLEWGLNWCVSHHAHQYLIVHAGAMERGGRALIFPAPAGSGKSTLCAALAHQGWRLLSDELALVHPGDCRLTPLPRPVSLKEGSIQVIRAHVPQATIGQETRDTRKGTIALMRPPRDAVVRAAETADPAWIVFPTYRPRAAARLEPFSKARTLLRTAESSFNYTLHGGRGFEALARIIDRCECYEFSYSDLGEATVLLGALPSP